MEQASSSQGSGYDPPADGKFSAPSTPTAAPALNAGIPTSKDGDAVSTDSMHDSDPANHVNSRVASTPSFSYNVTPNANESPHHSSANNVSGLVCNLLCFFSQLAGIALIKYFIKYCCQIVASLLLLLSTKLLSIIAGCDKFTRFFILSKTSFWRFF